MTYRRITSLGLAGGLLLLPLRALATSVNAPEFKQLVSSADYIVRAVVKSVTAEWREDKGRKYIATKVELEIREIIRGLPPQPLVLELVGGRIGEEELVVEGAPKFYVGDEDILFVQGNGRQIFPLVGLMHGRYPIFKDAKTGQEFAVRSNGMPLYSEQDVSLPMTTRSAVKTQNPKADPMTAATFCRKVREVVALSTPESAN